jgi:hypothetical protein
MVVGAQGGMNRPAFAWEDLQGGEITMLGNIRSAIAALALLATATPAQTVLSDNLDKLSLFSDSATSTIWLAAGFRTDAANYDLTSVALPMSGSGGGTAFASVELWTSTGTGIGQPGALLATLAHPPAGSGSPKVFTASGLALQPVTDYWIILRATQPTVFNWRWTVEDTGAGVGFTGTWGISFDAGGVWETYGEGPLQMKVIAQKTGAWSDLGLALPGVAGKPVLVGTGSLLAGCCCWCGCRRTRRAPRASPGQRGRPAFPASSWSSSAESRTRRRCTAWR